MAGEASRNKVNIGASSLILIFIVLCMATFGLLSLSSAQGDLKLAGRNGEAVQAYYEADSRGQQWLKEVDQVLTEEMHILRVDVKEHVAGAAVQPVLLKGLGHAVIAVPVGEVVKALEDAADIFMPQLNHVGNRLVGGFFVVQTEAVLHIILEGAV